MRHGATVVVVILAAILGAGVLSAQTQPPATPLARALADWQDMRFGLFVHWGPVSLTGLEIGWSRGAPTPVDAYDALYTRFNPAQFDADEWVRTAKDAGMKYVVFTTKHHDGFSMWNTKTTDYTVMKSPFGRDVVRELADACRRQSLVFSTYYSILDWHHPDYPLGSPAGKTRKPNADMDRYSEFLKQQVAELVTNYGPLGVMWFDGEWEEPWTFERGADLYAFLRRLQPSLIINNRVSKVRAGMKGTSAPGQFSGDYDTPEQRIGSFNMERPWETCMTICQQWSWKPDDALKPLPQLIRALVTTAGGNGNLLLNVGPMPDGRIEPRQVDRLKEMGAWLRTSGESIYGTRGGPFRPGAWGASTRRGTRIYLHIFEWEGDTRPLPAIAATVTRAGLLDGRPVEFSHTGGSLTVRVPPARRDPVDTVVVLDLDRPAIAIAPVEVAGSAAPQAATPAPKPDYSGIWVVNPEKSRLADWAKFDTTTITIEHKEPKFRFHRVSLRAGKTDETRWELTTDGAEIVEKEGSAARYSRLTWDGDALVYHSRVVLTDGREVIDTVRYSFRDSGKTFVAEEAFRGPILKYDNLWVADRK